MPWHEALCRQPLRMGRRGAFAWTPAAVPSGQAEDCGRLARGSRRASHFTAHTDDLIEQRQIGRHSVAAVVFESQPDPAPTRDREFGHAGRENITADDGHGPGQTAVTENLGFGL